MEKVLSEIEAIISNKEAQDYLIAATHGSGSHFSFTGQGDVAGLISKVLETIFLNNPQKAMGLISELLRNIADWYELDSKRKTIH